MRLTVAAIGRLKAGPERDLVARYVERAVPLARRHGLDGPHLIEAVESRARRPEDRQRDEAALLLGLAGATGPGRTPTLFALDERGPSLDSEVFARLIAEPRDRGAPALAFLIGGPDGLDPSIRERAALFAFGAATIPHGLARVLLAEQIYRALTILDGHPYHRGA